MRIATKYLLFTLYSLLFAVAGASAQIPITDVAEALKSARGGDIITIASGEYRNVDLRWYGYGEEGNPIVVRAEEAGTVKICGESSLIFGGEWLTVDGLLFTDGFTRFQNVITFYSESFPANHCTLQNTVIDGFNTDDRSDRNSYVGLYGRYNTVANCSFLDKLNFGVTLIVWLSNERDLENHHQIVNNYFGPRPVYGSNGAETIRVGTSREALMSSCTRIEGNLFEECNGEVEVISIKSSDNVITGNVFLHCEGVLALRHGNRNVVEHNAFFGGGRRNTGGIRVINEGHTIRGNYFDGLAGSRFFSALAVMDAVPNSLPNRYCQVRDVQIVENIFRDCANLEFGTGRDAERTLAPENVTFARNLIINSNASTPYTAVDNMRGVAFESNWVMLGKRYSGRGFTNVKKSDIIEATEPYTVGEIENLSWDLGEFWEYTRIETGASWYEPQREERELCQRIVVVENSAQLRDAVRTALPDDVIVLAAGEYALPEALRVRVPLTIRSIDGLATKPVIRYKRTGGGNMVTIMTGCSRLTVQGIAFDGRVEDGYGSASAAISTDKKMVNNYNLTVTDCDFYNYGESTVYPIRGMANTFADTVVVTGCTFRDLSGDAINYAAEHEGAGKYNADVVLVQGCVFDRFLGAAVNIERGGSDESTAGPYVTISGCSFEDVSNKERGAVLRLIGVQVLDIFGCRFSNSGRGGGSIRLDEATWEQVSVRGCTFKNSGRIISNTSVRNR